MRHLITLLCLVAAIASYIVGSTSGAAVFLILGVLLEGTSDESAGHKLPLHVIIESGPKARYGWSFEVRISGGSKDCEIHTNFPLPVITVTLFSVVLYAFQGLGAVQSTRNQTSSVRRCDTTERG